MEKDISLCLAATQKQFSTSRDRNVWFYLKITVSRPIAVIIHNYLFFQFIWFGCLWLVKYVDTMSRTNIKCVRQLCEIDIQHCILYVDVHRKAQTHKHWYIHSLYVYCIHVNTKHSSILIYYFKILFFHSNAYIRIVYAKLNKPFPFYWTYHLCIYFAPESILNAISAELEYFARHHFNFATLIASDKILTTSKIHLEKKGKGLLCGDNASGYHFGSTKIMDLRKVFSMLKKNAIYNLVH